MKLKACTTGCEVTVTGLWEAGPLSGEGCTRMCGVGRGAQYLEFQDALSVDPVAVRVGLPGFIWGGYPRGVNDSAIRRAARGVLCSRTAAFDAEHRLLCEVPLGRSTMW